MSIHDDDLGNLRSSHEPVILPALRALQGVPASEGIYAKYFKGLVDVIFVIIASPIIITLIIVAAILVACDGHNPFYTQERVGKDGRLFRIFKLRSMVPNSDALLKEHLAANPEALAEWTATQKLRNDPRVTRVGRFIRKCSIDEMPQFLNVLLGDMSIVGPRPFMKEQRPLYSGHRYFDLRPGVTGLWQISTRNEAEFLARVHFDDLYARTLSFGGDIRIVLRTVVAVIRGTGC